MVKTRSSGFQSTLPRGSDYSYTSNAVGDSISIHAPSRERSDDNDVVVLSLISIHAPSRERIIFPCYLTVFYTISIHAPSRERSSPLLSPFGCRYFNPRSLAGAMTRAGIITISPPFQSTLPRGSDRFPWRTSIMFSYFNPRSLAGAISSLSWTSAALLFQSTLPRGSDGRYRGQPSVKRDFNPRSLAGATAPIPGRRLILTFQSTLPRGSE